MVNTPRPNTMPARDFIAVLLLAIVITLGVSLLHGRQTKPTVTPARTALLVDGSFEIPFGPKSPWYLLDQAELIGAADAPDGKRVISFQNQAPGRASQAKQHIRLDGRTTPAIDVSVRMKLTDVGPGQSLTERAAVSVQFFDDDFTSLGGEMLGPWLGTLPWTLEQTHMMVPERCRVALVIVGLGGGTGGAEFDQLEIKPAEVNPSALPRKSGGK
jgi:hypothetical protein